MSCKFLFDRDKCTGCGSCVISCMDEYNISTSNAYRRLYQKEYMAENGIHVDFYSVACQHCEDAPCMSACPKKCFHKDEDTDFILLDSTHCVGCKLCEKACGFGAISYDRYQKAVKCNGCIEKVRMGLPPICAENCFIQAISLKELTGEEHGFHTEQIKKQFVGLNNGRI